MGSLRLHPKYGVNPSVDVCFWCGEARGVVLLGSNKGKEAPREMVTGYDPCSSCKENMAQGITLVEAAPSIRYPDRPEIQAGVVPTGRWLVVKEDALGRVFNEDTVEQLLKSRKAFVEAGPLFDSLLPDPEEGL